MNAQTPVRPDLSHGGRLADAVSALIRFADRGILGAAVRYEAANSPIFREVRAELAAYEAAERSLIAQGHARSAAIVDDLYGGAR